MAILLLGTAWAHAQTILNNKMFASTTNSLGRPPVYEYADGDNGAGDDDGYGDREDGAASNAQSDDGMRLRASTQRRTKANDHNPDQRHHNHQTSSTSTWAGRPARHHPQRARFLVFSATP